MLTLSGLRSYTQMLRLPILVPKLFCQHVERRNKVNIDVQGQEPERQGYQERGRRHEIAVGCYSLCSF